MRNWLDIGKTAIFRDKSKNGSLFLFLKEYKEQFGGSINPSCGICLEKYWKNYINSLVMGTENTHGYVLKLKYNGIFLKGDPSPFRNGDLTEARAKKLLKNHPAGESLFAKMPKAKKEVEKIEVKSETAAPEKLKQKRKRIPKKK